MPARSKENLKYNEEYLNIEFSSFLLLGQVTPTCEEDYVFVHMDESYVPV